MLEKKSRPRKIDYEQELRFILRRAIRFGEVFRKDLCEAFPGRFKATVATRLLNEAVQRWPKVLIRQGTAIQRLPQSPIPIEASEGDLIRALSYGTVSFSVTGLRPDELPITRIQWFASRPQREGSLNTIVRGIVCKKTVEIEYVGLKRGDSYRWRRVFPLGLELLGEQWRLLGHDLDAKGFPVKFYVLSRIRATNFSIDKLPKGFDADSAVDHASDRQKTFRFGFDVDYTEDQRAALSHELQIKDDVLRIPSRSEFDFKRQFVTPDRQSNAIWPPIVRMSDENNEDF